MRRTAGRDEGTSEPQPPSETMVTQTDPASVVGEFRRPRVLVVDGDDERAHRFAVWLAGHDVTRAHRGDDALDHLREVAVDVVVVARRLPDMSGAAVLSSVRDRELDARVAMVCGPDEAPPVTAAELDTVLRLPLAPGELAGAVTDLLTRRDRQRLWLELSSKRVRRNVLSVERPPTELADSAAFDRLVADIDRLDSRLGELSAPDPSGTRSP